MAKKKPNFNPYGNKRSGSQTGIGGAKSKNNIGIGGTKSKGHDSRKVHDTKGKNKHGRLF